MTETAKEAPPALCRHGWYDGKQSHVCYQPAEHPPPCKCKSCGAVEKQAR